MFCQREKSFRTENSRRNLQRTPGQMLPTLKQENDLPDSRDLNCNPTPTPAV
ncbi:hypothetical protein APTSU1_001243300 [Apodemus speciosus]|uniref:Uncharacterized protein n=1 Tax=Apodemus speciosus TaxID=105296 RepID=A0ABQ0FD72_APOSI